MTVIEEINGACYEVEYGPGCDDCWGLGAVFVHVPSCDSDLCVGNGDERSCLGSWLPCDACGTLEPIHAAGGPDGGTG